MGYIVTPPPSRGLGDTLFRDARCKDCLREQLVSSSDDPAPDEAAMRFEYSEAWATKMLDRGGSRTDRCARHRREHRQSIQGIAVAYVDLTTIGEVSDRVNPTGPLGGLGELPATHRPKPVSVDLSKRQFGMTDDHIRQALRLLGNVKTRVLVLKAGTGTGKSTFAPYRLMNPPTGQEGDDELLELTKLGPIIVTEPRVQATTGVARFVGEKLVSGCKWKICSQHGRFVPSREADPEFPEGPDHLGDITENCVVTECTDHIGPGYPVGYQVKDDKKHDDSCQLIYVTDGTMVNWLREGRLSKIGTVIVDEAHERSVNIDFIMGELKRQLHRYPHLRVIVTSATFDVDFYVDFFGGPDVVEHMNVPAVKTFGYGAPFFPHPDPESAKVPQCVCPPHDPDNTEDAVHRLGDPHDYESWLTTHWPKQMGPVVGDREPEDLHATTRKLESLRFPGPIISEPDAWGRGMPALLVEQVIRMIKGLHDMKIHGDILAFLPTANMIQDAVTAIESAIAPADSNAPKLADVYGLVGSMPKDKQAEALAARSPDARRKVVIATNLAETSLTVEGVRFVVDSGIITQSTWDPSTASGGVPTRQHSQSGIRQRWGRVGRDAPGWVFPLYTTAQFSGLPENTPPGSTRENLEKLIMTAKAGGVDNLDDFPWPAGWDFEKLDKSATDSIKDFREELVRAEKALKLNGVIDSDHGHLTAFGKEMQRFSVVGASAATALAVMFADQLACVPEVAAALALLDPPGGNGGMQRLFLSQDDWSASAQAASRLRRIALRTGCADDLDLALRASAGWDRSDRRAAPWELSPDRRRWCAQWWLDEKVLLKAAEARQETLAALSPAMKEEVKRFIDSRLTPRARAVLSRALTSLQYVRIANSNKYASLLDPSAPEATLARDVFSDLPDRVIALKRDRRTRENRDIVSLAHLIRVVPWAAADDTDVFQLLERAAGEVSPRAIGKHESDEVLSFVNAWPVGLNFIGELAIDNAEHHRLESVTQILPIPLPPEPLTPTGGGDSNWLLGSALADEEALVGRPVDTADDPNDPEAGLEANDDFADDFGGEPEDVLAAWRDLSNDLDVKQPAVLLASGSAGVGKQALGCVGYRQLSHSVAIVLTDVVSVVDVEVPVARRRGRGSPDLTQFASLRGTISCEYLPANGPLRLVAAGASHIRALLQQVDVSPAAAYTAVMRMPEAGDAGHIIGKGGIRINELKGIPGMLKADLPSGSKEWLLAATSVEAIEAFVEGAQMRVPGCTVKIQVAEKNAVMIVKDRLGRRILSDWRFDDIVAVPIAEWLTLDVGHNEAEVAIPPLVDQHTEAEPFPEMATHSVDLSAADAEVAAGVLQPPAEAEADEAAGETFREDTEPPDLGAVHAASPPSLVTEPGDTSRTAQLRSTIEYIERRLDLAVADDRPTRSLEAELVSRQAELRALTEPGGSRAVEALTSIPHRVEAAADTPSVSGAQSRKRKYRKRLVIEGYELHETLERAMQLMGCEREEVLIDEREKFGRGRIRKRRGMLIVEMHGEGPFSTGVLAPALTSQVNDRLVQRAIRTHKIDPSTAQVRIIDTIGSGNKAVYRLLIAPWANDPDG